ncbi:cobyric acid synthase [Aureivirga sp. CE67]|uniref:cobyric acid synthase n=1 Tax=Aureivirga sp. CE67 TaxID=1788983 RepID=UPI0018CAC9E1|nr:cobyric acid synthase [Aureivirga sp. CE67]
MKNIKPLMFVGTGSDVGKSVLVTGICKALKRRGFQPAPFKAQNMSLNSYSTPDGFEIGRAQAVQAEACEISCHTDMNPILLKPSSKNKSQIVLNGKPIGSQTAKDYFLGNNKTALFEEAKKAFGRLEQKYFPIVMEGAGSISELNLKHRDIVNMRMAQAANANVYLVADIDKGGVFASVYGTIALLEEWERKLVKGIIINKFRGDIRLFEEGIKIIEDLTKIPVLGVVPFAQDIYIEEEDSVALKNKNKKSSEGAVNIAVIHYPYISNYTDFNVLEKQKNVHLYYTSSEKEIAKADVIILPGTKNTIHDLQFLKEKKIDILLKELEEKGKTIIGICGGYQMLGTEISDPFHVEGSVEKIEGIGIFPIQTILKETKITEQTNFSFKNYEKSCVGYEIHMGETTLDEASILNKTKEGNKSEGYQKTENCWGTYMHGILDNEVVINDILKPFQEEEIFFNYKEYRVENYQKLADLLEESLNFDQILKDMEG